MSVFVHYLRIQAVCNSLPRFFPLFDNCGGVSLLFNLMFNLLVSLHEDLLLRRGEVRCSRCHSESVIDRGVYLRSRVRALIQDELHLAW